MDPVNRRTLNIDTWDYSHAPPQRHKETQLPERIAYWLLSIAYLLLSIAYWLLSIAYWLLSIAYWMLAIAYWLLPERI
jgi:hypothetical protein